MLNRTLSGRPLSRRAFCKHALFWTAAPNFVPAFALGLEGTVAPSDRITLGVIGVGAQGLGHVACCVEYPEAQVLAVCDVDRWRRERGKNLAEEAYAAQRSSATYHGCQAYNDLRELLARDDIDAVLVATGDRWHGLATVLAAKAGKDIYCEKPLSLTIHEAKTMIEVVHRYGRVFQSGLQQRSTPEFRKACHLVRAGCLGKVKNVYVNHPGTSGDVCLPAEPVPEGLDWDLWLGPAPWRPYNRQFHPYGQPHGVVPWHFCRDFGGGNLTSNGVHAHDIIQWGLGADESGPLEIIPPESGQVPCLTYKYSGGVLAQVVPGTLDPRHQFVPEGWNVARHIEAFGALFVGERGWIHVGRNGFFQWYPPKLLEHVYEPHEDVRPVNNHHLNWFQCIRTRQRPACDVVAGCRSTIVSLLGCIAHWTGRPLRWDPIKLEFPGDEDANRMCSRAMREPWRL